MRVLIDLNVVLDLIQDRPPHADETVLSKVSAGRAEGFAAAHEVATLFYVMRKHSGRVAALAAVEWILANLKVLAVDEQALQQAMELPMADFEDAVIAWLAEEHGLDLICTRNVEDFHLSPVPTATPTEVLAALQ